MPTFHTLLNVIQTTYIDMRQRDQQLNKGKTNVAYPKTCDKRTTPIVLCTFLLQLMQKASPLAW